MLSAVCQSNELEREIMHKTGGASRGAARNLGGKKSGLPTPPLRTATAYILLQLQRFQTHETHLKIFGHMFFSPFISSDFRKTIPVLLFTSICSQDI